MKTGSHHQPNPTQGRPGLFPCRAPVALAVAILAFFAATANANIFVKADNATALNLVGSYTNNAVPYTNDIIQIDNTLTAARSASLGDNLSVYAINQTGVPGVNSNAFALTVSATAGKTLTLGAGGITKSANNTSMFIGCALALGANQTWSLNSPTASYLQLSGPSFADNGYTLTVTGIGRFDLNNGVALTYGPNVTINCSQLTINNAADDITLGGANGFTNLLVNSGTVEGSSFPTSTNAGTTSSFGTGNGGSITLGGNVTSGTLIYNGNTAATPKSFTFDCRNSGADTIKVSTAGQTLTLTNLLYSSSGSQTNDKSWNFGGAGNLTIAGIGAIKPSGSGSFKIGVNKNDAGTLTLAGTNTYTGNTLINGGTLALSGNGSISNTPVIFIAGGAKFDVSGRSSPFALQPGQVISNSPTSLATLAGNLNTGSGTLAITFNPGTASLTITGGVLTISSSTVVNLTSLLPRLSQGATYPLITAGVGGSVAGTLPTPALTGVTAHLVINGSNGLDLVVDNATLAGVEPLHWAGTGSGTWDAANSGNSIWKDSTTPTALSTYFVNIDTVQFDEQYISANQAVALSSTVSPASTLVNNANYTYTISGSGAISGTGNLTKDGAGTLTLATANTYTGGTVISNGIIKLGNPTALGANGATVNVKSGAALDVNGTTMTSANTNILTLNGSGPAGGGALVNGTGTAASFFGPITLGSDSTIKAASQNLTLGSGSTDPITGSYVLTFGGGYQVDIFGNIQVASVTSMDAGTIRLESANTFAGGLTIKSGTAIAKNAASYGGNGSGTIYLLDTAGTANATLALGASGTYNNPIIVRAGSTGTAIINNYGGTYLPVWAAPITLSNSLTLQSQGTAPTGFLTVSGTIGGSGALTIGNQYAADTVKLSGTNTYSGATYVTVGTLALTGNGSISNTSAITVSGGATFDVTGTTSGTFALKSGQTLGNTGGTANLNGNFDASSGAVAVSYDGATPVFAVTGGSLNLSATTAFTLNTLGVLPLTTYNLIASGVSGTAPTTVTMARGAGYLVINGGGGLDLVVTSTAGPTEPLHWAGTGTGLWQFGTPTNVWKDSSLAGVYSSYADSDEVQFDELFISGNQVVTLNSTVTPPSILVSNSNYNYTISGTGTIGGSAPLTKTGNATLVLHCGLNTTGTLTNNGGTIQLASLSASARKVGGLAGSGGTLDVTTNRLTVGLTGQTDIYSGNLTGNFPASAGGINLGIGFGLQVTNSGTLALDGAVTISAALGSLSASSSSSSIGALNSAELDLGGTTTLTNATIRNNQTGKVRFTGGNHSVTFSGIADIRETAYGIVLQDSSECIVEGGNISVPAVQIGYGGAPSATGPSLTINGGALTVGANDTLATNGLWIGDNVTSGTISTINLNGGVLTVKAILDGNGITTSGNNIINFNGGRLVCASTNVFPADNGYNGANPLQLLVGNGGAAIDTAGYDNSIILPLQNNGAGGLTKLGLGALILATNNTYQGPTVVSNGTLLVNGSLDPASTVTVQVGGTLGGVGTIGGAVAFNSGSHAVFALETPLTLSSSLTVATSGTIPDVHLVLSNNVPVGTYPLATYSGGSGVFSATPVIDSGSFLAGTAGTIVTSGSSVTLQVVNSQPNPTNITYAVSGSSMTLNWPAGQGWLLQSNSIDLSNSNDWHTVTGVTPPYPITINPSQPTVFYRLKY